MFKERTMWTALKLIPALVSLITKLIPLLEKLIKQGEEDEVDRN